MKLAPRTFPWPVPFIASSIIAYALLVLTPSVVDVSWLIAAVTVNIALLVAIWTVPWEHLPRWAITLPAFAFLLVVLCLREATGTSSGYSPLVFIPVVWLGLHSRLGEIIVASFVAGAVVLIPAALGDTVDGNIVRATMLFTALSLVVGLAIRRQVIATAQHSAKLQKLQALHLNDAVVQQLTRAQLALEVDDVEQAKLAISTALTGAKQIVTTIIRSTDEDIVPGRLRTTNE